MNIACLGWGSLIWKPGDLKSEGLWRTNGPMLPIEFLRQSTDGRLTLVIHHSAAPIQTMWDLMTTKDRKEAVESLRQRENTARGRIGSLRKGNQLPKNDIENSIYDWLMSMDKLDAVIWTNLGPKFNGEVDRIASITNAVAYLAALEGDSRLVAEEYIRMAPASIETKYRKAFEKALGWYPLQVRL